MVTGETDLLCTRPLNEELLKKVLIGIFALKVIQNCETDFKIHSYEKNITFGIAAASVRFSDFLRLSFEFVLLDTKLACTNLY